MQWWSQRSLKTILLDAPWQIFFKSGLRTQIGPTEVEIRGYFYLLSVANASTTGLLRKKWLGCASKPLIFVRWMAAICYLQFS